eukprot:CAMPEP_0198144876 /NCGR_PEP_ID=MMETSP1443-20131203/19132_1 /TAXON_ID=186043 /ORGANISM="Entomoneis sp., Strain CCMP2396" /LENGTH=268 /DNA_ID=CAMNT_0043808359 /DNA_START=31 /DNA_END=837 /DNA_ORIENTATION=+
MTPLTISPHSPASLQLQSSASSALRRKQASTKATKARDAGKGIPDSPLLKEQALQESIERMKSNLSRFARVSNKRMALRTLHDCNYLRSIPLDTTPTLPTQREELTSLEEEVCVSNTQVNGLLFNGSASNQVLKVLRALCQELCKGLRVSSETIYMAMIVRLANSSNSSDSYFSLNALMGSQDLVLKPRQEQSTTQENYPPTDLSLYEAGGQIHAVVTSFTSYGLFRRSDVKSGKSWIALSGRVHERVNLTTGASVRFVHTQITTPDL